MAHTVGIAGQSLILGANAPNLGSMYVLLKPFDERHGSDLTADAIAAELQSGCHKTSSRGRRRRRSARRRSTASAPPAASS